MCSASFSPGTPSPKVPTLPLWVIIFIIHSFYIALFSALKQTHCARVICDYDEWLYPFIAFIINIHGLEVVYWQRSFVVAWLVPRDSKCCRHGASSVYTIQPCTSLQCHVTSLTPLWAAGKMRLSGHDHRLATDGLSLSEIRLAQWRSKQQQQQKQKN